MPAINDENEGALGSFCKLIRQQPQLTIQGYNGLSMFFRNNTQLFMEAKFTTDEDHKFLHKLARETGSGEQAWQKAGVDHCDDKQHRLIKKQKKKEKKAQENSDWHRLDKLAGFPGKGQPGTGPDGNLCTLVKPVPPERVARLPACD